MAGRAGWPLGSPPPGVGAAQLVSWLGARPRDSLPVPPRPVVFRRRVSGQGSSETEGSLQPRAEMSQYVNDLWPGSPQDKESPSTSRSGRSSRLSSASRSRSSSGSARSGSSGSSRASSRVRTRRRSRSRSWSRRLHQRKYRRYSRSYSRSRSRSRGRRYRDRRCGASGRYRQSPSRPRSRSRSRSRGRSYYRRASALPRGRRFYGFGRSVCPEEPRVGGLGPGPGRGAPPLFA